MSSLGAVAASNLDSNYRGVHVLRYSSICRQVVYKCASINLLNKVDNSSGAFGRRVRLGGCIVTVGTSALPWIDYKSKR